MTPLPKQRRSHSRTRRGRAHHAIKLGKLVECDNCGQPKRAHHVCLNCGQYNGRQVFEVEVTE